MENKTDPKGLEYDLNVVIKDLVYGLRNIAKKIEGGAEKGDVAELLELLARTICDHWPDCFALEKKSDDY